MALNIRDREVDQLAAELAQIQRSTKTEAVKKALQSELAREKKKLPLWDRIKGLREELATYRDSGIATDKAFYDDLSGEID